MASRGLIGATEYPNDQSHELEIVTEPANRFSGRVSLPAGFLAEGDEFFFVRVRSSSNFVFDSFL